jgi:uncharacterized protein YcbX
MPRMQQVGTVRALFRYPVKSMAAEELATATLGWHGLEGDRRFAFVREGDASGFPWLTASKLQSMVLYRPSGSGTQPTHVTTPDGVALAIDSDALREELTAKHGVNVRLMFLKDGIFDDAPLSVITTPTLQALERASERPLDVRRFRPNIVVDTLDATPFGEDAWLGKAVHFGSAAINVTMKDVRCGMINIDPDTAAVDPTVLKAAVRANDNCAGIYGATLRTGTVSVGDAVYVAELC